MVVELKGQQIRIREHSPTKYFKFRTQDLGMQGKLQRIAGYNNGRWETQAWRLNLSDYDTYLEVEKDIAQLKTSTSHKAKARKIAYIWFKHR